MGTIGARRIRRSSLSSKRAQQSVETIEAYIGRTIGSDTGDNSSGKKTPSGQKLADDTKRSLDKTNKR